MRAIVKVDHKSSSFQIVNLPEPELIQKGDIKLKMLYSGICGTDLHIYHSDQWAQKEVKTPHINGHEGVGKIVAIKTPSQKFKIGDYVTFESHIFCEKCHICQRKNYHVCEKMEILGVTRNGVWSEFVVLPEKILFKLDEKIPLEYSAILEPFGNAYHTQSYSNLTAKNVLVTGDGPIGLFAALIARTKKPKQLFISGLTPQREIIAQNCGLTYLNVQKGNLSKKLQALTKGEGIDVILECSGSIPALKEAVEIINPGGEINVISLYPQKTVELPLNLMIFKNIRLQLVTGRKIWKTWEEASALIQSGKIPLQFIQAVITDILPFSAFKEGFQKILAGKAGKVLLTFEEKKQE